MQDGSVTFLFGLAGKGLDLYHVGLTVPDIDAATQRFSDAFGFTWATVHESTFDVIADDQPRRAEIAVTYSAQGPPYLELVEERRGSIWGADGFGLTHVGFWADDVDAARQRLNRSGVAARVYHDAGGAHPMRFSYHELAGGLWLELVHTSFAAQLADWILEPRNRSRGVPPEPWIS
jgi:hypothetical protein